MAQVARRSVRVKKQSEYRRELAMLESLTDRQRAMLDDSPSYQRHLARLAELEKEERTSASGDDLTLLAEAYRVAERWEDDAYSGTAISRCMNCYGPCVGGGWCSRCRGERS